MRVRLPPMLLTAPAKVSWRDMRVAHLNRRDARKLE